MKAKILTKYISYFDKVYILLTKYISYFVHILQLSFCHLYNVLTLNSLFCDHCPSQNCNGFKSCNDKAIKSGQNASNMWI